MTESLRITEIFFSIQGESTTVGLPTVFVRLTGCPLRCVYCDTEYAFKGGKRYTIEEILEQVDSYGAHFVTVTGGEPLAQPGCFPLLSALCDKGYDVSLETSGAVNIANVDPRTMIVMDLKTPSSQECDKNLLENLNHLKKHDQIKFVIGNREDYEWSKQMMTTHDLNQIAHVLFSPTWGEQSLASLAEWILADKLPVRMQLQIHKVIWPEETQGR